MKKEVNTDTISVRIPSSLSDKIDNIISRSATFNYRSDLVQYATSMMMEDIFSLFISKIRELEKNKLELTDEKFNELFEISRESFVEYGRTEYCKYDGDLIQILIRVPFGWTTYLVMFSDPDCIQDFIRYSIIHYIESDSILIRYELSKMLYSIMKEPTLKRNSLLFDSRYK